MTSKGFLSIILVAAVAIIAVIVVVFLVPSIRDNTIFRGTNSTSTVSCSFIPDEKFFPQKVGEYQRQNLQKVSGDKGLGASYSNVAIGGNEGFNFTMDGFSVSIFPSVEDKSRIADLYRKALKNNISDSEFGELSKDFADKGSQIRMENIAEIPVLIIDNIRVNNSGETLGQFLIWQDESSGMDIWFAVGAKSNSRYIELFKSWYGAVCP